MNKAKANTSRIFRVCLNRLATRVLPLVIPISYGLATLTGLSRIHDDDHWASDVFFGAALGYFTSKTILRLHSNKKGQHFTIHPRADHKAWWFGLVDPILRQL